MCVICVKRKGQALPDYEMVKAMAETNPHGFGFATPSETYKSMDFYDFYEHLKKVKKSEPCIMHFRLATHGSKKRDNCHPFTSDGISFAHNGILDIVPIDDKTDSETAFETRILPVVRKYGFGSRPFKACIEKIIGYSKFAFLNGDKVATFGPFTYYKGYLVSNKHFVRHYDFSSWYADILKAV